MSVLIGLILRLVGLTHTSWEEMLRVTLQSFPITISAAFIIEIIDLIYGRLFLVNDLIESFSNWFTSENIIDLRSFVTVSSVHNFSCAGGIIELVAEIIYSLRQSHESIETTAHQPF